MKFKVFSVCLLALAPSHSFSHFVFVPQAIESALPKNQSVISINYGLYSQDLSSDAVVITIDQKNEKLIGDKFKNLYQQQRYIYVLSQKRGQWSIIAKNTSLLTAKALPTDLYQADNVEFSNSYINGGRSTAYIAISPTGFDQDLAQSQAAYSLTYSDQDRKSYITEESYSYDDPLDQNRYCAIAKTYTANQIEFSKFQSNQRNLVLPAIKNKQCN